jgi:hypothetical protein
VKVIKKQLAAGLSKKEIFEKASVEGGNLKKVTKYLAMFPDDDESKKYNKANNILIGVYTLLVIIGLLGSISMISELPPIGIALVLSFGLLIPATVIYCIYKKQSLGYLILCFFLFKGVLDSFKGYESDPASVWIGVSINVVLLIFIVVLKSKLFPHQNFFNTKKDSDGFAVYTKI